MEIREIGVTDSVLWINCGYFNVKASHRVRLIFIYIFLIVDRKRKEDLIK